MTERKKLKLFPIWYSEQEDEPLLAVSAGDLIDFMDYTGPFCEGIYINTSKRDLLDAFHEVYLQGQRDRENNVLHAPNLFNILGLKE